MIVFRNMCYFYVNYKHSVSVWCWPQKGRVAVIWRVVCPTVLNGTSELGAGFGEAPTLIDVGADSSNSKCRPKN